MMEIKEIIKQMFEASEDGWVKLVDVFNSPDISLADKHSVFHFANVTGALAMHRDGMLTYAQQRRFFS